MFKRKFFNTQFLKKIEEVEYQWESRISMKNYPFENKFLKISDFVAFGLKMSLAFNALFN